MTYPIILWKDMMALGSKKNPDPNGDFFFVKDFPLPRKELTWQNFPTSLSIQPEKILPLPPPTSQNLFPQQQEQTPSYLLWQENLLQAQKNPSLKKVVLARRSSFTFTRAIDPFSLFFALKEIPNTHPFAFILSPTRAFLGATPELLYKKEGSTLYSEALAATRPLAKEDELLTCPKEQSEFAYVQEALAAKFAKIAHPFILSPTIQIKRTKTLAHLHYPFHLTLKESLSDEALINYLHPTPAIAGTPTQTALDFIATHEPFDRGWYAGCIGHKKGEHSEVFVAIRSGQIEEKILHLYAGAGILPTSNPYQEWLELDHKIASFGLSTEALR
jgi:menaquinone-specific isochorismate synthase